MQTPKDELGKIVDQHIRERVEAMKQLLKAEKELGKLGVKIGNVNEDGLPEFEVGPNYLPQFAYHLEEYEWEAIYKDKTSLRQHDIGGDHHYGNIDQEKLKEIRYISNFYGENDNQERRVIATLNWISGKFDLLNATISPEDRAKTDEQAEADKKKLILFKRVRFGQTMEIGERIKPTPEVYFYKRYFLGYETKDKKFIICLFPNGEAKVE